MALIEICHCIIGVRCAVHIGINVLCTHYIDDLLPYEPCELLSELLAMWSSFSEFIKFSVEEQNDAYACLHGDQV